LLQVGSRQATEDDVLAFGLAMTDMQYIRHRNRTSEVLEHLCFVVERIAESPVVQPDDNLGCHPDAVDEATGGGERIVAMPVLPEQVLCFEQERILCDQHLS
jgi:hypothetical protein